MLSDIFTVAFVGVYTVDVNVQVHIANGIPAFNIVGMPDKVVAESRERIRAALISINALLPSRRVTVNLSPAGLIKEGSHYDLPIAVGILSAMKIIKNPGRLSSYVILGELSLDGRITSVCGVLAAAATAKKRGKGIICPSDNANEAFLVGELPVNAPGYLSHLLDYLNNENENSDRNMYFSSFSHTRTERLPIKNGSTVPDMQDVMGQEVVKRAALIAAAGSHNLLMIGPPGTGKSMVAKRIPGILPDLCEEEIIDINIIYGITRNKQLRSLITSRPFREPHSSASMASMVGGGTKLVPGEITLAHNGVLFLDELPEFSKSVLEALRQPLEDKKIVISRANAHITYPANFQLVAAMNPCKCGYLNDIDKKCTRAPRCAMEYQRRISGPIMSRIDIKVEMSIKSIPLYNTRNKVENSASIKKKVISARLIQKQRYGSSIKNNASLTAEEIESFIVPHMCGGAKDLLEYASTFGRLSSRDFSKILKISRTISDICGSDNILEEHVAEAMGFFISKAFFYGT